MITKRYFTEQEQKLLLSKLKSLSDVIARRDYAWVRLLIVTGFRVGELSLLTVNTALIALKVGYIHIPREHRKGKKQHHDKLVTQPVREALIDLLDIRREMGYTDTGEVPLIMSRKHTGMTVRAFQHQVAHWAREVGIPGNPSPHWFRHTRAMNIMRRSTSNDPRGIVQAELGHGSIASSGIYTQMTREDLERHLQEIDGKPSIRKRQVEKMMANLYEGRVPA
jgi:site-specific recombinase XerC